MGGHQVIENSHSDHKNSKKTRLIFGTVWADKWKYHSAQERGSVYWKKV